MEEAGGNPEGFYENASLPTLPACPSKLHLVAELLIHIINLLEWRLAWVPRQNAPSCSAVRRGHAVQLHRQDLTHDADKTPISAAHL